MGVELAERALRLGAEVILVIVPSSVKSHSDITRIDFVSAQEMYESVHQHNVDSDIIIMSAAVADYSPVTTHQSKLKKMKSY